MFREIHPAALLTPSPQSIYIQRRQIWSLQAEQWHRIDFFFFFFCETSYLKRQGFASMTSKNVLKVVYQLWRGSWITMHSIL